MLIRTSSGYIYSMAEYEGPRFVLAHYLGSWVECGWIRVKVGEPIRAGGDIVAGGNAVSMIGDDEWETVDVVEKIWSKDGTPLAPVNPDGKPMRWDRWPDADDPEWWISPGGKRADPPPTIG